MLHLFKDIDPQLFYTTIYAQNPIHALPCERGMAINKAELLMFRDFYLKYSNLDISIMESSLENSLTPEFFKRFQAYRDQLNIVLQSDEDEEAYTQTVKQQSLLFLEVLQSPYLLSRCFGDEMPITFHPVQPHDKQTKSTHISPIPIEKTATPLAKMTSPPAPKEKQKKRLCTIM